MDTIKIFIASSSEVAGERLALENYINSFNIYYYKYGVYLQPILWELESKEFSQSRKQDYYNEKLLDSDMAIFIFGSRVGEHTKEEFDVAVQNKMSMKKPKHILAYFKNISLEAYNLKEKHLKELGDILKLKEHIDANLKQVYVPFSNEMDLKLQVGDEINRVVVELIYNKSQLCMINNILMLPRKDIHERLSIDERLHISDNLYTSIRKIRLMNIASNFVLSPDEINKAHQVGSMKLSDAIEIILQEKKVTFNMILTEPSEYNLLDINTKVARRGVKSANNLICSSLKSLYNKLIRKTIYKKMFEDKQFALYLMKISMPFAIFNVEFLPEHEEFNHVKVDLYSAAISDEDERRSFIIWQKDDPDNYNYFVNNFDSIKNNTDICIGIDNTDMLKNYL